MRRVIIVALLLGVASFTPAVGQAQTETVSYYHTDAIGSVRMVTDEAGQVVGRHDYQPFGLSLFQDPPPPPERRQFAGKERDTETNFDYFGARYYASGNGRFTTVDPVLNLEAALTDPQRWNRYTYAVNNPLKLTDPDGRDPRLITGAIGAVVYAGWNTFVNVQQGNAWYQSIGIEASKGFLVGVTLGLAAPALAGTTAAEVITSAPLTMAATAGVAAGPQALSTRRDQLLDVARNAGLRDAIDNLFRLRATIGDGSSMAAYAHEKATGQLLSPTGHARKLLDRLGQLDRLTRRTDLSANDRKIAEGLIDEIHNVLR